MSAVPYSGGGEPTEPRAARTGRAIALALALVAPAVLSGCGFGYYARLAVEQGRFLCRAKPIEDVIATTKSEERRARLQLVLDVRRFAAAQGLDPGGSYRTVSDVTGLAVAHVVTAAHRDKLEAYQWHYPFVGAIPYHGYFDAGEADVLAAKLAERGYDTLVVRAAAYSTLGWFDDPLPSSLLERDSVTLAATVLHELSHQRLFVRDHIAFNETFANAVGMRLATAFFRESGDDENAKAAADRYRAWLRRGAFYDELAGQLDQYFRTARGQGRGPIQLLAGRQRLYGQAQQRYRKLGLALPFDNDFSQGELDNARFLAMYRYAKHAAAFDRFFSSSDDMPAALEELSRRVKENDDPFAALALQ